MDHFRQSDLRKTRSDPCIFCLISALEGWPSRLLRVGKATTFAAPSSASHAEYLAMTSIASRPRCVSGRRPGPRLDCGRARIQPDHAQHHRTHRPVPKHAVPTMSVGRVDAHHRRRGSERVVRHQTAAATGEHHIAGARPRNFEHGEAHSPTERDHVSFIEERPHPFLRDSPLEFGVGIFVARKEFVPNYGRGALTTSSDHWVSCSRRMMETSTVTPSFFTSVKAPIERCWDPARSSPPPHSGQFYSTVSRVF